MSAQEMPDGPPAPIKYVLDGVGVHDHRVEVRADGRLRIVHRDPERGESAGKLDNTPAKILDVLVGDRHGGPFDKERMADRLQELFPEDRRISTSGVRVHINGIRGALGDRAKDPGFIETVSREGYELCASVEILDFVWPPVETPKPLAAETSTPPLPPLPKRRYWPLLVLASVLVLVVPILLYVVRQPLHVGLGSFDHEARDPVLGTWSGKLASELAGHFEDLPEWSLWTYSDFPLDQPARVGGRLDRRGNRLDLVAELGGLPSGCRPRFRQEAPEAAGDELARKLARNVRLHMNWEACVEPLRLAPWDDEASNERHRALHCLEAARQLRRDLRYCEAKELLVLATALEPDLPDAWDLLANVHQNIGDDREALAILERYEQARAPSSDPRPDWQIERRISELRGDYEAALGALLAITTQDSEPSQDLAWFYQTHLQDCSKASGSLEGSETNPALAADLALACGDPQEAIRFYEQHHEERSDASSLYARAHGYRSGGQPEKALADLDQALESDPRHHRAQLELIGLYTDHGCANRAAERVERLLRELEPAASADGPNGSHCRRGQAGQVEPSLCPPRLLQRDAHIAATLLYPIGGTSYEEALDHAREARFAERDDPENPHRWSMHALWAEGRAHLAAGRLDALAMTVAKLGRIAEVRADGGSRWEGHYHHHLRGRLALAEGRFQEAIEDLGRVFDFAIAERAFFRTELALAYLAGGDEARARSELEAALELDPRNSRALCELAELVPETEARSLTDRLPTSVCQEPSTAEESCRRLRGPIGGNTGLELP